MRLTLRETNAGCTGDGACRGPERDQQGVTGSRALGRFARTSSGRLPRARYSSGTTRGSQTSDYSTW